MKEAKEKKEEQAKEGKTVGQKQRERSNWSAWLWFPVLLGLILAAIGIWYAKYTDWWLRWLGSPQPSTQTINSGASVFVSSMSPSTPTPPTNEPADKPAGNPDSSSSSPTDSNSPSRPRMW